MTSAQMLQARKFVHVPHCSINNGACTHTEEWLELAATLETSLPDRDLSGPASMVVSMVLGETLQCRDWKLWADLDVEQTWQNRYAFIDHDSVMQAFDLLVNLHVLRFTPDGKAERSGRVEWNLNFDEWTLYGSEWPATPLRVHAPDYLKRLRRRPDGMSWLRMRELVFERDDYTCQYCGKRKRSGDGLRCDHVIPVILGGRTVLDNLATLCASCDTLKRGDSLTEWLK